jgi:hypothetical protein
MMGGVWGRGAIAAVLGASLLAGCADTTPAPTAEATALAPAPILKREGMSLAGASVAVVSLDGAPAQVRDDFVQALTRQFSAHGVVVAEPKKAHYLLRGYLAATSAEGGANLDYVLDVYDARRQRVARLEDGTGVKGEGDAWSLMSPATLDSAASTCADDVEAFLSNTPEAKPAAAQALSYAQ